MSDSTITIPVVNKLSDGTSYGLKEVHELQFMSRKYDYTLLMKQILFLVVCYVSY